jgi:hypothetical protein
MFFNFRVLVNEENLSIFPHHPRAVWKIIRVNNIKSRLAKFYIWLLVCYHFRLWLLFFLLHIWLEWNHRFWIISLRWHFASIISNFNQKKEF